MVVSIDPAARAPIREMADLLENVPPARLFDEMLKLLMSGHAVKCLRQLREEGLHHGLLPLLDVILEQPMGERFVWLSLENTDERVRQGKPVSPGFLFADSAAAFPLIPTRNMSYARAGVLNGGR